VHSCAPVVSDAERRSKHIHNSTSSESLLVLWENTSEVHAKQSCASLFPLGELMNQKCEASGHRLEAQSINLAVKGRGPRQHA
jgi:hypothetical protein